ncbi:MAG: hypothetical protein GY807_17495 [Gammaproteobacteria bacterium]|nr:hypothetical protein [Gammaproteobacteria bacterium]
MSIEEAKEKYLPLFLADSYPEDDARAKLDTIFDDAEKVLAGCKNQLDFHGKIKNSTEPDPDKVTPTKPFSLLPGLIECAPFELDIRQLLLTTMSHDGDWERTKPAMRFFELWNVHMTKQERAEVIIRLIETDKTLAAYALALYFGKIAAFCADDPELIERIFRFIEKYAQFLPILSTVPISKIPRRLKWDLERWIPREKLIRTDNVIPVRHVNNYAGSCVWMSGAHYATLEGSEFDPDVLGDVTLLYVDNFLVGSMKMYRDPSIVGLRTIQDSQGRFPVLTSGVYVTTKEITIQAQQAFREQGKWTVLRLDRLPLFPMEFMSAEDGNSYMLEAYVDSYQSIRRRLEKKTTTTTNFGI